MFQDLSFELGKLVVKIELAKGGSARMLRDLGGGETEIIRLQKFGKYWNQQRMFDCPEETRVWRVVPAIRFQLEGVTFTFTLVSNSREVMETIESAGQMLNRATSRKPACSAGKVARRDSDA